MTSSILLESTFSHGNIILCFSSPFVQISFNLRYECTKTFRPSHKRERTQNVNGDKRREKKKREKVSKEKVKRQENKKNNEGNSNHKKKLIRLINSPVAAPKT